MPALRSRGRCTTKTFFSLALLRASILVATHVVRGCRATFGGNPSRAAHPFLRVCAQSSRQIGFPGASRPGLWTRVNGVRRAFLRTAAARQAGCASATKGALCSGTSREKLRRSVARVRRRGHGGQSARKTALKRSLGRGVARVPHSSRFSFRLRVAGLSRVLMEPRSLLEKTTQQEKLKNCEYRKMKLD